ncbi:MAG: hypothetical protein GX594_11210, partial [Pirellulaceae bacterium]|nr:hypothetical protein [Pirellulaceae bacterium]
MIARPDWQTEMRGLLDRLQDGGFDAADRERLNDLLRAGAPQREFFITYMDVHSRLAWEGGHGDEAEPAFFGDLAAEIQAGPQPPPAIVVTPTSARRSEPFVGELLFSCMVASVFVCLLLLGFWAYKLPSDRGSSIASNENSRGLTAPGESSRDCPAPVFVGRVTGIAGARWSDEPNYIAPIGVRVALGRTYKLKSG